MSDQSPYVIQRPINSSVDESKLLSQLAANVGTRQIELAGSVDEFLSAANSQALSGASAGIETPNGAAIVAWHLNGFVETSEAANGDTSIESVLKSLIERAAPLGIERISFAPAQLADSPSATNSYAAVLNRTASSLTKLIPRAERCGVRLCVRPAQGRLLTSPVELREMITGINSSMVGVDLPTALPTGVAPWTDWFKTLEPAVRSIRVPVDIGESDGDLTSKLGLAMDSIGGVCAPRPYGGVVTICQSDASREVTNHRL